MSKINDLIKELCPNGVEYKNYGDVFEIKTGKGITTKDASNDGLYPIISGGTTPMGYYEQYNRNENTVTVSRVGANAGFVSFIKEKFYLNDKCFSIIPVTNYANRLLPKFVFHYTKNIEKDIMKLQSEGGVPTINTHKVSNLLIPIPPLEIQEEIVRNLDKFVELEVELEVELDERKNQYEFWSTQVFDQCNNLVKLDEICYITAGGTPSKNYSNYWEQGTIKWLGSTVCENKKGISEITNYITELGLNKSAAKLLKPGTTLIAMVGATIGKVAFLDFEACTNQNVASLYPKNIEELDTSYLYHACRNLYSTFLDYANGKFAMASLGFIKNLEIPLPDIKEQKRIAKLLDKFDKLINDINEGIPAEIELRRKQYEYYRNKLLSFEELKVDD